MGLARVGLRLWRRRLIEGMAFNFWNLGRGRSVFLSRASILWGIYSLLGFTVLTILMGESE